MDLQTVGALITGGSIVATFGCVGILALALMVRLLTRPPQLLEKFKQAEATFQQRALAATPATAMILASSSYTPRSGGKLIVDLTLDVHPPFGNPYRATTKWQVDFLIAQQMQPNQTIAIRIDLTDPNIIFPNIAGAEYQLHGDLLSQSIQ